MNVLVDTSVWSPVLRRPGSDNRDVRRELSELIAELRLRIIGPIRQELLSGIRSQSQFDELKTYISAFRDLALETPDFEKAAEFLNTCRCDGVQGSHTDFLICSVAYRRDLEIFTFDKDFIEFQRHLPIRLYSPRVRPE